MSRVSVVRLTNSGEWTALWGELDPSKTNVAVLNLTNQFSQLKASSCLIEHQYLDQDFTEIYSKFYARVFKRHHKDCRRFHFFTIDIGPIFELSKTADIVAELNKPSIKQAYLGFIVIRPIKHAPIARAVIKLRAAPAQHASELMVRSIYDVHFCGATFSVTGTALTQQDSRVGSCAQAAIWMAGRHFHQRHRGPWFSTVAITEAATTLAEVSISQMIPIGSESLHPNNMLQALKAMEREPLIYTADRLDENTKRPIWGQRPQNAIYRYVDSGIPVILGLGPLPNDRIGHATLATGIVSEISPSLAALNPNPTLAEFVRYFVTNDDQRGGNILLPINQGQPHAETNHTLVDNLYYLIVPLPPRVYISAERAEETAWDMLKTYAFHWPTQIRPQLDANDVALGDGFTNQLQAQQVIARTYLTYGWKYKKRMLMNDIHETVKDALMYLELPRYVWVTEFGYAQSLTDPDPSARRIQAHLVMDATASKYWECRLLFHAPGRLVFWQHDAADPNGDYVQQEKLLIGDQPYRPKIRGQD